MKNVSVVMLVLAALELSFWVSASPSVETSQMNGRVNSFQSTDMGAPQIPIPAEDSSEAVMKNTPETKHAGTLEKGCNLQTEGQKHHVNVATKCHDTLQQTSEDGDKSPLNNENSDSRTWSMLWIVAVAVMLLAAGPGLKITFDFALKLNVAKGDKRYGSIDKYDDLHDDSKTSVNQREEAYATLVSAYYDLATEFYEWGWGTSFHFADRRKGENFSKSILRHETYLAGRLGVNKGAKLLDCGCGVGGPARNIAQFTGAHVTGITINAFQVQRGNTLTAQAGLSEHVKLVQGDFMKLPFPDNSFDGVYAIEATCHAPDRNGVYSEILRVLKPGGIFATYEWCLTDSFDQKNPEHLKIKKDIEVGDGLPDMCHTSVCTKAIIDSGFELVEARDAALDGHTGGDPWFRPLTPGYKFWVWPRFQFNPVMIVLMPKILGLLEILKVVPTGTSKTQVMLQAGGIGCERGGATGIFTPMWLMVGRKPSAKQMK